MTHHQHREDQREPAKRVALVEISFGKPEGPFWHPRQPRIVNVAGKRVEEILEREGGRIDLNTADEKYLVAAPVTSGLTGAAARTGAARIRDWIDADDKPAPGEGAERSEYRPRNCRANRATRPWKPSTRCVRCSGSRG